MSERFQALDFITQLACFDDTGVCDGLIVYNDWLPKPINGVEFTPNTL